MKTIFLFIFTLLLLQYSEHQVNADPDLALISDSDVPLILVSTLDGVMTAIDSTTGHVKWKFKEHPLLKTPKSVNKNFIFLPNPQDGQLYFYREHALKKISSSIHQLVQQSPCKTTENVLFAGAKKDEWLAIDFETGLAVETMTKPTKDNSMCLVNNNIVFVGRTEYQLTVRNTSSNAVWNTTYFDYTSDMAPDPYHPNFYLSTPIDGKFLCIDKDSKDILWEKDLESVVVGTYILKKNGMSRLQNIVIGPDTFHKLTKVTFDGKNLLKYIIK
uniref:PQQ_3 domain-containing protein n=1 Tax=Rhabditophanes sp. KR3021 TaxID=114890 RepID=A0AC35U5G0_9BILA